MSPKYEICPPRAELADFAQRKLDANRTEILAQHLVHCDNCRQFVAQISDASSSTSQSNPHGTGEVTGQRQSHTPRQRTYVPGESVSGAASETPPADNRHWSATPQHRPVSSGASTSGEIPPELTQHPDYELMRELGRGGMGVVYLARNRIMDRLEVLKVVDKSLLNRPGALERFQQEIRSAARLAHPNIVAAYSVLRPGDWLVFAMEYVQGHDLAKVVNDRGPLPVINAAFYGHQVALGLQHAHEKAMVHRDIKPNNLMLAFEGKKHVIKILDFGLAKATSEKAADAWQTKSGQMLGTPDYVAPEQMLDAQKADIRADVYSLGCTLYFLLSGHPPFQGTSLFEILQAHHSVEAPPLNQLRPDVPEELAAIIAKMMAKAPVSRYQTPGEVCQALGPFFKSALAATRLPPTAIPNSQRTATLAETPAAPAPRPIPIAHNVAPAAPLAVAPAVAPAAPSTVERFDAGTRSSSSDDSSQVWAKYSQRGLYKPIRIVLLHLVLLGAGLALFSLFELTDGVTAVSAPPPLQRAAAAEEAAVETLLEATAINPTADDALPPESAPANSTLSTSASSDDAHVVLNVSMMEPDVFVDGRKITINWTRLGTAAELQLPAGAHKIGFLKDGFEPVIESIELAPGSRRTLTIKFERSPSSQNDVPKPQEAGDVRTTSSPIKPVKTSIALAGREEGLKKSLWENYGGSAKSEAAVSMGLDWLKRFQQPNGAWSLKGPYSFGSDFENIESATALALLALQGAGNSHKSGKYSESVAKGLKHLLRVQKPNGDFFQGGQKDEWLYCHAQCTIAICELLGMTNDPKLRDAAERAVKFCVEAQDELGGWRYRPRVDSDTSVTGWMVMALQSAKMADLDVPVPTLSRIGDYLDKSSTDDGSRYAYLPGYSDHTLPMTAESLLCRQYLGWSQNDPRLIKGAQYVADNPPKSTERDVYYWYYATQLLHHMEGRLWNNWNTVLRDLLVSSQELKGLERGSWDPRGANPDVWAARGQGGRLYVTCLKLLMLEVYYRHLPLYSQIKKKLEAAATQ
jgi:serine/threonine protein kinase